MFVSFKKNLKKKKKKKKSPSDSVTSQICQLSRNSVFESFLFLHFFFPHPPPIFLPSFLLPPLFLNFTHLSNLFFNPFFPSFFSPIPLFLLDPFPPNLLYSSLFSFITLYFFFFFFLPNPFLLFPPLFIPFFSSSFLFPFLFFFSFFVSFLLFFFSPPTLIPSLFPFPFLSFVYI